jgi:hypothetical protein
MQKMVADIDAQIGSKHSCFACVLAIEISKSVLFVSTCTIVSYLMFMPQSHQEKYVGPMVSNAVYYTSSWKKRLSQTSS